jgi:predicted unusual protein kinase regulating ubiquinone biosynthesis (AarF/ABC1/UbiB family)
VGRLTRLAKLGGLTSRLTGHGVRERLFGRTDRLAAARDVAESLGQLKGAAMKVGQQVGLMASALDLPDEVQRTLGRLNDRAREVPFEVVTDTLREAWDGPWTEHLATLEARPLGTASLAQAHAATLPDGRAVVVKVLHPGVLEGLETDLLALRGMLGAGRLLGRRPEELQGVLQEVEARLREEVDYLLEAVHLHRFDQLYGADERVVVPTPVPSLCTDRVLVMDRVHGVSLDAFVASASDEAQQRAGLSLAELFFEMAFEHRLLHADPHPGNYLFQPDGTVGLIDFGCVKAFDEFFLGSYARVALAALDGDRARTLEACRALGVWQGDTPEAGDAIWAFCDAALSPWRGGPCVLGEGENLVVRCRAAGEAVWRYPEVMGVPDMLYLHRALAGMYTMARTLRVEADWGALTRRHLERAVARSEGG